MKPNWEKIYAAVLRDWLERDENDLSFEELDRRTQAVLEKSEEEMKNYGKGFFI